MKASIGVSAGPVRVSQGLGCGGIGGLLILIGLFVVNWKFMVGLAILMVIAFIVIMVVGLVRDRRSWL